MTALVLFACVVGAAVLLLGVVAATVLLSGWRGRG